MNTHVFIVAYVAFHGSPDASPELIVVTLPVCLALKDRYGGILQILVPKARLNL